MVLSVEYRSRVWFRLEPRYFNIHCGLFTAGLQTEIQPAIRDQVSAVTLKCRVLDSRRHGGSYRRLISSPI